jgi:riboflavin kinase, archaea type
MPEIKLQHILTLTQLLVLGARHNFVETSTTHLGKAIGRSQQAVSKHLMHLENLGYIERVRRGQKFRIKVTEPGYVEMERLFLRLRSAMESAPPDTIEFEGKVVSGLGEGAYYMSLIGYRKQFKEKLGYEPFPGTLNVKLTDRVFMDARHEIGKYPAVFINGFSDNKRTYGWAKCYPASINNGDIVEAAMLVLERTHHDDSMMEIIARFSIKDTIGVRNGDKIKVKVFIR